MRIENEIQNFINSRMDQRMKYIVTSNTSSVGKHSKYNDTGHLGSEDTLHKPDTVYELKRTRGAFMLDKHVEMLKQG